MINKRKILLTPEIGDWTLYLPEGLAKDVTIGSVGISKFDRLSRDELVEAHMLHYKGFEGLIKSLTEAFKIKTDLYSLEVIQTNYDRAKEELGPVYHQATVVIDERFSLHLYIQNTIANALLDRGLGGKGDSSEETLTPLEQKVFEKVVEQILLPFLGFWNISREQVKVVEMINGTKEDLSLNPQNSYSMYIGKLALGNNTPGNIVFAYSRESVVELLDRYARNFKQAHSRSVELSKKTQSKTRLPFTVEIGSTEISMKELMSLSEGDVIKLDNSINGFVKGRLSDTVVFNCFPGMKDDRYSVQVLSIHDQHEDEIKEHDRKDPGVVLLTKPLADSVSSTAATWNQPAEDDTIQEEALDMEQLVPEEDELDNGAGEVAGDIEQEEQIDQFDVASPGDQTEQPEQSEEDPPVQNEEDLPELDDFSWDMSDEEPNKNDNE